MDANGDELVDFGEFFKWWLAYHRKVPRSLYEADRIFGQFSQDSVSSVTDIGNPNDTNCSDSSVSSVSLRFRQFSL